VQTVCCPVIGDLDLTEPAHRVPAALAARIETLGVQQFLDAHLLVLPIDPGVGAPVRRLSEVQVAYYRAAHRLHHLIQISASGSGTIGVERYVSRLDELSSLDAQAEQAWFPDRGQARQWRQVINRLRAGLQVRA
jgi:hypothetical protein